MTSHTTERKKYGTKQRHRSTCSSSCFTFFLQFGAILQCTLEYQFIPIKSKVFYYERLLSMMMVLSDEGCSLPRIKCRKLKRPNRWWWNKVGHQRIMFVDWGSREYKDPKGIRIVLWFVRIRGSLSYWVLVKEVPRETVVYLTLRVAGRCNCSPKVALASLRISVVIKIELSIIKNPHKKNHMISSSEYLNNISGEPSLPLAVLLFCTSSWNRIKLRSPLVGLRTNTSNQPDWVLSCFYYWWTTHHQTPDKPTMLLLGWHRALKLDSPAVFPLFTMKTRLPEAAKEVRGGS